MQWIEISIVCERVATDEVTTLFGDYADNGIIEEDVEDQPFLYSQLLGILDSSEDANEDMMRTASAISIVRGFLQQSKIDDTVAKLMCDISNIEKNSATIKSLQESKGKITSVITSLAQDSCISLKHNKNAKKGENTWTGKIKKIKELNLREGEVNGFDLETCKAMSQVMDLSNQSISQSASGAFSCSQLEP